MEMTKAPLKRKRRPYYITQREEIEHLQSKVRCLEDELRNRQSCPGGKSHQSLNVTTQIAVNMSLRYAINSNHLVISHLCKYAPHLLPPTEMDLMPNKICLGTDANRRQQVLDRLRPAVLMSARDKLHNHYNTVDPSTCYMDEDRLKDPDTGDLYFSYREIHHVTHVSSLRHVYNIILFQINNLEMVISEQLEAVALRENEEASNTRAFVNRIVICSDDADVEDNIAVFAEYQDDGEERATIYSESVHKDELHPYRSRQRVRKDINIEAEISHGVQKQEDGTFQDAIVIKKLVRQKLYKPPYQLSAEAYMRVQAGLKAVSDLALNVYKPVAK